MDGLLRAGTFSFVILVSGMTIPASASEIVVDQRNLTFVPNSATITVGDVVRFTDSDRITHNITVVYPDGSTEDKGMDRFGEDTIVHFTKAGTYQVRCLIHPMMHMTITVR